METENAPISDNSDIVNVAEFCLSLYKLQFNAPKSAPSKIIPVNPRTKGPDYIYELHVYLESENKCASRRMTIATLGEGSGSKSKCFKVIYDNLMVVKIPPSPITDFDEYIGSVRAETRIAVQLAPKIEFVAPGVTAILRKIHIFPDGAALSPVELEKKYVEWLKENPEFQEYLKIKNAFVFFMDLSRYSFLSQVVDAIHNREAFKRRIREEIIGSHNLLWDILGFEGKYGSENLSICFDMNRIYSDYEMKIRTLTKTHRHFVSAYEKQKWFLVYLAQNKVKEEDSLPSGFISDLNLLLGNIIKDNQKNISAYKKAIWDYISKTTFIQNRTKISGIITNIISLLASLRERGVAIRDLKPDNLFVVGDSERPAKDYSLGLIDFETAVKFRSPDMDKTRLKIEQPLLAGTPSYSTPSHLFKNKLLEDVFDDLSRILCLQDWQASVGMIYNIVTGECLFKKTRKVLPKITNAARKAVIKKQSLTDVFKKGSRIFWKNAVNEFREKTGTNAEILKAVEVAIPENAQKILLQDVVDEKNNIAEAIRKYVASQVVFRNKKNRQNLFQSSVHEISRYREKWEKGDNIPETSEKVRVKIITLLRDLEHLKLQAQVQDERIKLLEQAVPKMSAHELLEIMLNTVLNAMYNEEWGKLSEKTAIRYDKPDETPIVFEDTFEGVFTDWTEPS